MITLKDFLRMYCGGIKIELSIPVGEYDSMEIVTDHNQLQDTNIRQHLLWLLDMRVKEFTITEDLSDAMTLFISLERKEV